jgi:hypothetical protein
MDFSVYHTEVLSRLQPLGDPNSVSIARNVTRTQLEVLAIKVPVLREVVDIVARRRSLRAGKVS